MLQNFPHEFLSVQVSTLQNRGASKKKLSSKRHQSVTRSYAHTHENCVNKTSTDSKSSREKKEKNQRLGRFGRGGTNGKRLWTSGARELTVLLLVGCWKLEAKHTQQSSIIFWYLLVRWVRREESIKHHRSGIVSFFFSSVCNLQRYFSAKLNVVVPEYGRKRSIRGYGVKLSSWVKSAKRAVCIVRIGNRD